MHRHSSAKERACNICAHAKLSRPNVAKQPIAHRELDAMNQLCNCSSCRSIASVRAEKLKPTLCHRCVQHSVTVTARCSICYCCTFDSDPPRRLQGLCISHTAAVHMHARNCRQTQRQLCNASSFFVADHGLPGCRNPSTCRALHG